MVEGRGPVKPGSLIIQGANSRGYPEDEVIKDITSSAEEFFIMLSLNEKGIKDEKMVIYI